MRTKQIVKLSSLFTLILAFMVTTVVAIAAVVTGSNNPEENSNAEVWFDYTSNSTNPLDYNNPANYELADFPEEEPDCPSGDYIRCAIKALPSSTNPDQPNMATVTESHDRAE